MKMQKDVEISSIRGITSSIMEISVDSGLLCQQFLLLFSAGASLIYGNIRGLGKSTVAFK